jgi:hypothetical protein
MGRDGGKLETRKQKVESRRGRARDGSKAGRREISLCAGRRFRRSERGKSACSVRTRRTIRDAKCANDRDGKQVAEDNEGGAASCATTKGKRPAEMPALRGVEEGHDSGRVGTS